MVAVFEAQSTFLLDEEPTQQNIVLYKSDLEINNSANFQRFIQTTLNTLCVIRVPIMKYNRLINQTIIFRQFVAWDTILRTTIIR